jgi:hypothetical protein
MTRLFALSLAAGLALLTASPSGADEPYSVTHNGPVTVRILGGKSGQPLAHAHLLLLGGYDERELHDKLWREEAITDAHGQARLSKQFANLPWLQVWVNKRKLCQAKPGKASFSVELMLRDGLSTPNRCGTVTVEDTPGVFTVFVKDKGEKNPSEISLVKKATPNPPPAVAPVVPSAASVRRPAPPALVVTVAPVAVLPPAWDEAEFQAAIPVAVRTPVAVPVRVSASGPARIAARRVTRRAVRRPKARRARPVQATCRAPRTRPRTAAAPAKITTKPTASAHPAPNPPAAKHS